MHTQKILNDKEAMFRLIEAQLKVLSDEEVGNYAIDLCKLTGWSINRAMEYITTIRAGDDR